VGTVLPVVVLVLAVAVLATVQTLHSRSVGRQRRLVLRDVEALFDDVTITQDGIGYPSLRGRRHGHTVKVELSVDALAMRQLPVLWMLVTVLRPLPVRTPIDITLRPRSSDIVSAGTAFAYEHAVPEGWPQDIRVMTPRPALPPLEALDEFVELLEQPTTKGLLIAPGGVRIVHELARGAVGQYRVVRRPKFSFTVQPERLQALLDIAERVADRVEAAAGTSIEAPA
jgi:hypothetical protein